MKFETYKMENALEYIIDYRGKTPKKSNTGIITLSAKSVRNGYIDYSQCYYISNEEYQKFMVRGFPRIGDILLTTEAPLGVTARLDRDDVALAQRLITIRGKDGVLDTDYLYYYLKSSVGQNKLHEKESGTTVTGIKQAEFRKIMISVPNFKIQKKISSVLNALDEKITLNMQINDNLQQQADAIFQAWFVDYNSWNGSIPDTWRRGTLGEFVEIKRGSSPRPIQKYLSESGFHWLKISDVTNLSSPFVIDIKDHIIESGLSKTVYLPVGSLVLSNSATPGIPKILDIDSCIHDGWLYFPDSLFSREYLYLFFKCIRQKLINLSNGSVFNNLKTDILKNYPVVLPDEQSLKEFNNIVSPLFQIMRNLGRESHELSNLRDALLPRLMSGELDVSGLEI